MLTLLFAAAVATMPAGNASPTSATASARATVRIVHGVEIRFASLGRIEESVVRQSSVRERDGSTRSASLIEFY